VTLPVEKGGVVNQPVAASQNRGERREDTKRRTSWGVDGARKNATGFCAILRVSGTLTPNGKIRGSEGYSAIGEPAEQKRRKREWNGPRNQEHKKREPKGKRKKGLGKGYGQTGTRARASLWWRAAKRKKRPTRTHHREPDGEACATPKEVKAMADVHGHR